MPCSLGYNSVIREFSGFVAQPCLTSARGITYRAMSHGHDHSQDARANGEKGAYPHLSKLEVEKLGNFGDGNVLEASKWASVNDPHPTGTLQSPALLALSKVLGTACVEYNAAFFECKARTRNPEKCEKEGIAVTGCAKNVYAIVHSFRASDRFRPHRITAVCSSFVSAANALTLLTLTASTRTTSSFTTAVTSRTLSMIVRLMFRLQVSPNTAPTLCAPHDSSFLSLITCITFPFATGL